MEDPCGKSLEHAQCESLGIRWVFCKWNLQAIGWGDDWENFEDPMQGNPLELNAWKSGRSPAGGISRDNCW